MQYVIKSILWLSFSLIIFGCEKQRVDSRDKYLGEWNLKVYRSSFIMGENGYYTADSLDYIGYMKKGEQENELQLQYTAENAVTFTIDENDNINNLPTHYCSGNFEERNKIFLFLRWGGLGGGTTHIIKGQKR